MPPAAAGRRWLRLRPPLGGAGRPGMGPARPAAAAAAGGERRRRPGVPAAAREEKGLRTRHGQVRVDHRVAGAGGDAGGPAARRAPLRRGGEGDGSGPTRGLAARRRPEEGREGKCVASGGGRGRDCRGERGRDEGCEGARAAGGASIRCGGALCSGVRQGLPL